MKKCPNCNSTTFREGIDGNKYCKRCKYMSMSQKNFQIAYNKDFKPQTDILE